MSNKKCKKSAKPSPSSFFFVAPSYDRKLKTKLLIRKVAFQNSVWVNPKRNHTKRLLAKIYYSPQSKVGWRLEVGAKCL